MEHSEACYCDQYLIKQMQSPNETERRKGWEAWFKRDYAFLQSFVKSRCYTMNCPEHSRTSSRKPLSKPFRISLPDATNPSDNDLKSEEPTNNDVPAPPSIGQVVLDRLNHHIQQEKLEVKLEPEKKYLEQIGRLMRTWRIKNGYVRADMAKKLKLAEDRLLCIERGIGLPEDITKEQLLTLQSLLGTNALDCQFKALIQSYLISLKT